MANKLASGGFKKKAMRIFASVMRRNLSEDGETAKPSETMKFPDGPDFDATMPKLYDDALPVYKLMMQYQKAIQVKIDNMCDKMDAAMSKTLRGWGRSPSSKWLLRRWISP